MSSDPVVTSEHDVICARGLAAKNHAGNKRLRQLVQINLRAYSLTNTRQDKSKIVTDILDYIKGKGGDFVRLVDGKYQSVGDHLAREKIGQMFRDNLSNQSILTFDPKHDFFSIQMTSHMRLETMESIFVCNRSKCRNTTQWQEHFQGQKLQVQHRAPKILRLVSLQSDLLQKIQYLMSLLFSHIAGWF